MLKYPVPARSSVKINTVHVKEWMIDTLSGHRNRYLVSEDGLLQLEWFNK